jgi:hypothetical protein
MAFTKSGWTATPSLDAGEEPERTPVVGVVLAPPLIVMPMLAAVKTRVGTALKTTRSSPTRSTPKFVSY